MRFTYCPHCGRKLSQRSIGDEGVMPFCDGCNIPLWDSFTTSVIVAVVNEFDEIALLRQGYVSENTYVCVAGIMKAGESAEEAVAREVKEEIGQEAIEIEYVGSYPFIKKDMLMLGFMAEVKKQAFRLSCEVDSAEWFSFDEAPSKLRDGSIARMLVETVIRNKKK